jgi:succinyl-diaminopimelate desuccinylase
MRTDSTQTDRQAMTEHLVALLNTWTSVPANEHEVAPGQDYIVSAVRDVVRPMIEALGPDEVRQHDDGDLVARFGPDRDDGLLIQTYIVSQHGNLMDAPTTATIEEEGSAYGLEGPVVRGQGANQNKGPMAAVFAALGQRPPQLARPVLLAVNTEGRSSHGGSRRILDDLHVEAAAGVIATATDLQVSLGNRGRVDVIVTWEGKASHSSQPELGVNPILRSAEVVQALREVALPDPHPQLGCASVTPYQLSFFPVAPHTIPQSGKLIIDRRLLPGEDPAHVVAELDDHLHAVLDFPVHVEGGATMLPADVAHDAAVVRALASRGREVGTEPATMYSRNTFDAGYACSVGIPTVMFGPGKRSFGDDVLAAEVVSIEDCWTGARIYAGLIESLCT